MLRLVPRAPQLVCPIPDGSILLGGVRLVGELLGRGLLGSFRGRLTINMAGSAAKGDKSKDNQKKGLVDVAGFGCCADLKKAEIERLLKQMIASGFVGEDFQTNGDWGAITAYVVPGQHGDALRQGRSKLIVPFATTPAAALSIEATPPL